MDEDALMQAASGGSPLAAAMRRAQGKQSGPALLDVASMLPSVAGAPSMSGSVPMMGPAAALPGAISLLRRL